MGIRNVYPIRPEKPGWLRRYEASSLAWSLGQAVAAFLAGVALAWFVWG